MSATAESLRVASRGKRSLRIWLRLLSCTTLIEQQVRTRLRDEFEVTLPQFDVLAELDAAGEPQTMSELSRRLMVSNGNVTGVIDRLVRAGMVARQPSSDDRRVQFIALTTRGRRRFATMAAAHERWIDELLGDLGEADLLARQLEEAKHHLRAQVDRSQDA